MTRLVVEFAVRTCGRVEVHVVPGGLESQVHAKVGGRSGPMDLIIEKRFFKVSSGVLKWRKHLILFSDALLWSSMGQDL